MKGYIVTEFDSIDDGGRIGSPERKKPGRPNPSKFHQRDAEYAEEKDLQITPNLSRRSEAEASHADFDWCAD
jgi:hypothetical protein